MSSWFSFFAIVIATQALLFVGARLSLAWDNHAVLTRAALQAYEDWDPAVYEPVEKVLPSLASVGAPPPVSVQQLCAQLNINCSKVKWAWQPEQAAGNPATLLDVLLYASVEPDFGMDQDLNISPDQKYMGGFKGPSSQGIRHMYYRPFSLFEPLVTFHIPMHEMGSAVERAQLFFELARKSKSDGHVFWAHRFLGWGLHFVEDMGQPYHASQVGSLRLLPLRVLMSVGWEAFRIETERIVANFHLSFEQYVAFLAKVVDSRLLLAFKVPKGDESLKLLLEQKANVDVQVGVKQLAVSSSRLASSVVAAQEQLMGELLLDRSMNLVPGFYDEAGRPKIDFRAIETADSLAAARKQLFLAMEQALSNTGVAIRWYVDKFRAL